MTDEQAIRTGRNCVFMMHIHLVFVTKYRRHVFDADVEVRPLTLSAGKLYIQSSLP